MRTSAAALWHRRSLSQKRNNREKTTSFVRNHSAVLSLLTFRFPMAFFGIDAPVWGLTT